MRVILDTSVVVSGLVSARGASAIIISHWLDNHFTLLYSTAMVAELEDVLNRTWITERLVAVPNRISEFMEALILLGEPVTGYVNVAGQVRDPFDEMFLVCARLGQADYLVTLDKDLLALSAYHQTQIILPSQFLQILRTLG